MSDALDAVRLKAEKTYNRAADNFDAEPLAFWDRYGQRTVERMMLSPGARVLDVCCGSGASALPAARAVGSDGSVIAIDLADELLKLGRAPEAADRLLVVKAVRPHQAAVEPQLRVGRRRGDRAVVGTEIVVRSHCKPPPAGASVDDDTSSSHAPAEQAARLGPRAGSPANASSEEVPSAMREADRSRGIGTV